MNWGHYITIAFILFATFIMYMVISAFNVNIDLVADDYYAQEIAYENKMIQKRNFKDLGKEIGVVLTKEGVLFEFPTELNVSSGEIYFYHPSRKIFDNKHSIQLDKSNKQLISRKNLVAGRYRVNISWESDEKVYFQQASIFVK